MNIYPLDGLKISVSDQQITLKWNRCEEGAGCICVSIIDESTGKRSVICRKTANYMEKVEIPGGYYSVWRMRVIAFASDTWVDNNVADDQKFWAMLRNKALGSQVFLIGRGSLRYRVKVMPLKGQSEIGMDQVTLTVKTDSSWGPGVLEYGYDQQWFPLPGIEVHSKPRYPAFLVPKGAAVQIRTRYPGNGIDIQRYKWSFF